MRTTVNIPESLIRQARAKAALDGIRMADVVNAALSQYLGLNTAGETVDRKIEENVVGQFRLPVIRAARPGSLDIDPVRLDKTDALDEAQRHAPVFGR